MQVLLSLIALVGTSNLASASESEAHEAHSTSSTSAHESEEHRAEVVHEEFHYNNVLGVRGMYAHIPGSSETAGDLGGLGVIYERVLLHNRLALELSIAYFAAPGEHILPLDIVVKVPYEIRPFAEVYAGVGPVLSYVHLDSRHPKVEETSNRIYPGAIATAGVYWWTSRHFGILTEFDFTLMAEETLVQEHEYTLGFLHRF